jgi:hypothetical protein
MRCVNQRVVQLAEPGVARGGGGGGGEECRVDCGAAALRLTYK